ncbi:MAG: DUF3617 family protein [Pseudomonadota bacterium]
MQAFKIGAISFAITSAAIAVCAPRAEAPASPPAITPGVWQLQQIDGPDRRQLCVANLGTLLKVSETGGHCSRAVMDSDGRTMTVHYACNGSGRGRNVLTVRSASSIRLETQGVAGGAPFAVDYDGRRVGSC